jgi:hypothetical protein
MLYSFVFAVHRTRYVVAECIAIFCFSRHAVFFPHTESMDWRYFNALTKSLKL